MVIKVISNIMVTVVSLVILLCAFNDYSYKDAPGKNSLG